VPSKGRELQVYGIRNCDSCRRALKWLQAHDLPHRFHDVREQGLDRGALDTWLRSPLGPRLLNRRGTAWRRLPEAARQAAQADPLSALAEQPMLLKRPVITAGAEVLGVGFDPTELASRL
jgi:arsenate reductase